MFTYATVCSGIEACSQALDLNIWDPIFFSEIEQFPSEVLKYHYPNVKNLGDMKKIKYENEQITNGSETIRFPRKLDLLAGGTPCQDFSIAGKRLGANEELETRSSLCWQFIRLVSEFRPRVILWENVCGCFSTNGGQDFSRFVSEITKIGYGVSWRVLDCQYTRVDKFPKGLPQRRKRVWLVGCIDDDVRGSAEILFEQKSLVGNTAPSRKETVKYETIDKEYPNELSSPTIIRDCTGNAKEVISTNKALALKTYNDMYLIQPTTIDVRQGNHSDNCSITLLAHNEITPPAVLYIDKPKDNKYILRKLLPIECERLMGFPDDFTKIKFLNKDIENCSYAKRHKAIGNSWAVNCAKFITDRITTYLQNQ